MASLSAKSTSLWEAYLNAERQRVRGTMIPALDAFIDSLLCERAETRRCWAREIAASIADHSADVPVRFPLFRRVLVPTLVDGVLQNDTNCARWLAHFESHLIHAKDDRLPEILRTSVGLLRFVVKHNPRDILARRRLVERDASYLEYTLHELPCGVLYGYDGATVDQCAELLQLLAEFKAHVDAISETDKYAELIRECDFHYIAYRDYLVEGSPGGSYEDFLKEQGDE